MKDEPNPWVEVREIARNLLGRPALVTGYDLFERLYELANAAEASENDEIIPIVASRYVDELLERSKWEEMNDLKPCPFCGGVAVMLRTGHPLDGLMVGCFDGCGAICNAEDWQLERDAEVYARRAAFEECIKILEDAFKECDTYNLLHGAARIRARLAEIKEKEQK